MENEAALVKKEILEQVFSAFNDKIREKDNVEFVKFADCKYFWESETKYKVNILDEANEIIKKDNWKESDIGTGKIYEALSKS